MKANSGRRIKIGILIVLTLVLTALLVPANPAQWVRFRFIVPKESRQILAEADTIEELQGAAGGLGYFRTIGENDWVAIRYQDTHSGGIYSYSLAKLSDGTWMESREHYCGLFAATRRYDQLQNSLRHQTPGNPEEEKEQTLREIEEWMRYEKTYDLLYAQDLAQLKAALNDLGFR